MAYTPFPITPGAGSGGGGGSSVHNDLTGRSAADAHPTSAITGLDAALAGLQTVGWDFLYDGVNFDLSTDEIDGVPRTVVLAAGARVGTHELPLRAATESDAGQHWSIEYFCGGDGFTVLRVPDPLGESPQYVDLAGLKVDGWIIDMVGVWDTDTDTGFWALHAIHDRRGDESGSGLALGETSSTAYRGDRGKTAYDHSQVVTGNPHGTAAGDITSGTFDAARIPNLDAAKITTGTIAQARLGTGSAGTGAKFLADDQTYKTVTANPWSVISEQTLGASAASVSWASLSAYKEFRLIIDCYTTDTSTASGSVLMRVNADSGTNYEWVRLGSYNDGSSFGGDNGAGGGATSGSIGAVPTSKTSTDYRGAVDVTVQSKTGGQCTIRAVSSAGFVIAGNLRTYTASWSALWKSTSAITDLTVLLSAGSFATGSYLRLEGRA